MAAGDAFHYEGQDLEALADLPRYYRWIARSFGAALGGRVVEVGAGVGNFASVWIPRAREAVLIEPARNLGGQLKQRFASCPHVRVFSGTLDDARSTPVADGGIAGEEFDAALLVNVLEHIPDDRGMLLSLSRVVRPGGAVLLFTPALPLLHGSLDRLVHHVRRYTRSTLASAVHAAGLKVEHMKYFDTLGVLPWFVMGRILQVRSFSAGAAATYDRFAVPLLSSVERRLDPPFGKNLVCIARRAADGEAA